MNKYIGHNLQTHGVQEYRLNGGKGDGMRMLSVRNGLGLEAEISLDRCGDISRLTFKGDNLGYFAPCGYVSPKYDNKGAAFLKSFTAGFLTTCGLTAVGSPCIDNGEELPLHGTISNTPSENHAHWIDDDGIHVKVTTRDSALFAHKLILSREYVFSMSENTIRIIDKTQNIGSEQSPFMMLYHFNIGYPLLSEKAELSIPSETVVPRDEHAKTGLDVWNIIESPQRGFEEMCYYHTFKDKPSAKIYNKRINKGLEITFDNTELNCFTQWKMMGENEYVLGLEPGNCTPDGRDVMRKNSRLKFIEPDETITHNITVRISE